MGIVEKLRNGCVCLPEPPAAGMTHDVDEEATEQLMQEAADEIERLERMVRQMAGMADQGIDAPNAAYRWCERIDEVFHRGPMDEYEAYAAAKIGRE